MNEDEPKPAPAPAGPKSGGADADKDMGGGILGVLRTWGPPILAVLFIRAFIFEPFRIPSGSMVPTLLIGDQVVVYKSAYGVWLPFTNVELVDLGDPERGDIIVFEYPKNPSDNYIKRVVGIPGDRISVADNRITLNGVPQPVIQHPSGPTFDYEDDTCRKRPMKHWEEDLSGVRHTILTSGFGSGPDRSEIVVPDDHVFVMGDNRDNSEDSRSWGFVRYDQIKGKAHIVWMSWWSCTGAYGSIRGDRLFHSLYGEPP
jgi:signal peptidase I